MTDQLTGLGGKTLLRIAPDWSREPGEEHEIARTFFEFPGTRRTVLLLSEDAPVKIAMEFFFDAKEDSSEFFQFFHDQLGRWGGFWFPSSLQHFAIVGDYLAGASTLEIERTNFMSNFAGRERLWIRKSNGDLLTFAISEVNPGLSFDDPMQATLAVALAESLANEEIETCGQLFYGRFDQDDFNVDWTTDCVCRAQASFIELPKEYPV